MIKIETFKNQNSDFYILSKGNNAGKPVRKSTANCFSVKVVATDLIDPDFYFYVVLSKYINGDFKPFIKGSVIPFITIEDLKKALI